MKYAFFKGCKIPYYLHQYETSCRGVLEALKVELIDLDFNCCGYPIRNSNYAASILSAARNMAMAAKQGLDIMTPCKCCYGNLKHAEHELIQNERLRDFVNMKLSAEGLYWDGESSVKHLLSVLYHDIGIEAIASRIVTPLRKLKVAAHYGCHALRPANVVGFDDPFNPTIFENMVNVTGAESVDWPLRLECCGNPLWEKNNSLSLQIMEKKIEDAVRAEADCICTACTYCQIQFDTVRHQARDKIKIQDKLPAVLFTQLLGKSFGLDEVALGLKFNKIQFQGIPMEDSIGYRGLGAKKY